MKTILASTMGEAARVQMSDIFVDGFYQWLCYFSKDKAKLARAFLHIFNPDTFYLAVGENGEIAGMAACTDGKTPCVRLDAAELRRHLGFVRGGIAHSILRKEFETKQYPFPIAPGMGLIEFVATAESQRGKGVASQLITDIIAATPYSEYALEVADINATAVNVYEKLGFAEFMRIPQKPADVKRSGINALVYMKRGGVEPV